MFEIFQEIELQLIRQGDMVIGGHWMPVGGLLPTRRSVQWDGRNIRKGDLSVSANLRGSQFDKLTVSITSDAGVRQSRSCATKDGSGSGCTVILNNIDICHAAKGTLVLKAEGQSESFEATVPFSASYVVTRLGLFDRMTERGGKVILRQAVSRSSVCS